MMTTCLNSDVKRTAGVILSISTVEYVLYSRKVNRYATEYIINDDARFKRIARTFSDLL